MRGGGAKVGGGRDRQTNRQVLMSSCSTSLREREREKKNGKSSFECGMENMVLIS